jgi:hypothetical protein
MKVSRISAGLSKAAWRTMWKMSQAGKAWALSRALVVPLRFHLI